MPTRWGRQPFAVQFGAGSIGRGFMGHLFWEARLPVLFVDVVEELVEALDARGSYPLSLVGPDRHDTVAIEPVAALHAREVDAVAAALARAEVACTAVGVAALVPAAALIAAGVRRRLEEGGGPLNVLLCENQLHCSDLVRGLLSHHLSERDLAQVGLVETVVGRMVPGAPAPGDDTDPLRVIAEDYARLAVDRAGILGLPPPVPALLPVDDFAFFFERKLYVHNMGHAAAAYLGFARGHPTIHAVMEDAAIAGEVGAAMNAAGAALCRKHGASREEMRAAVADLIRRFRNPGLNDAVTRVARDPLRKLRAEDRLVGALLLCLDEGIDPRGIPAAIAAAITYDSPGDPAAALLQEARAREGLDHVLASVCGLPPDGDAAGMIRAACERAELGGG